MTVYCCFPSRPRGRRGGNLKKKKKPFKTSISPALSLLGLMSVWRHSSFKYSDEEEAIRRLINTYLFVALHMSVNVQTAITVCTFTLKETLKMSKF